MDRRCSSLSSLEESESVAIKARERGPPVRAPRRLRGARSHSLFLPFLLLEDRPHPKGRFPVRRKLLQLRLCPASTASLQAYVVQEPSRRQVRLAVAVDPCPSPTRPRTRSRPAPFCSSSPQHSDEPVGGSRRAVVGRSRRAMMSRARPSRSSQTSPRRARLAGGCYLGVAVCGDVDLAVHLVLVRPGAVADEAGFPALVGLELAPLHRSSPSPSSLSTAAWSLVVARSSRGNRH